MYSTDFFTTSTPKVLKNLNHSFQVLFLPTDRVVRVQIAPSGVVAGHCRSVASQHRRAKTHGSNNNNNNIGGSGGSGSSSSGSGAMNKVLTLYTATGSVPLVDLSVGLFVYKGIFRKGELSPLDPTTADHTLQQKYVQSRNTLNTQLGARLEARGLGSIKELKQLAKQAILPIADARNKETTTSVAAVELPNRVAIKPPFWQLCDTDYLKDVLRKVFHSF